MAFYRLVYFFLMYSIFQKENEDIKKKKKQNKTKKQINKANKQTK